MNDNDNRLQMGGEEVAFATSSPPQNVLMRERQLLKERKQSDFMLIIIRLSLIVL